MKPSSTQAWLLAVTSYAVTTQVSTAFLGEKVIGLLYTGVKWSNDKMNQYQNKKKGPDTGMVVHFWNLSTWKVETGSSGSSSVT